ncbi:saccharopine dehydrogenase-like oxidoreductase isoform X2 [Oratosquilla oratoria]
MASLAAGQRYDLVVFGATGYTGQFVVEEVARVAQKEKNESPLTWAVAGRSTDKLNKAIETASQETGLDLSNVAVVKADVGDQESIDAMAAQAKVIINCVGPYTRYGECVVRACISKGASHVDISGEPQFLEGMQLEYNEAAREAGVHIVGACGYDSIPVEMGINHMIQNFEGEINSVENCVIFRGSGAPIHTGTMESAALAISNADVVREIRRRLLPLRLPSPKHRLPRRNPLHYRDELGLYAVPMPTDEPVAFRTQYDFFHEYGRRPVQFRGYMGLRNAFQGIGVLLGMAYFAVLCYFSFTRKLLLKYPEVMTAGVFSRKGAERSALAKSKFTSVLMGRGWSKKLDHGSEQHESPPDQSIIVKVSGPDPGYGATSIMLVASAMTILREKSVCARKGGVMTPGVAFWDTGIVKRLEDRGMTFEIQK